MSRNSETPITAAIIGAGVVGGYHIKAQAELGSNIVIFEPDSRRSQAVADQYSGQVVVARTIEEAIEQADTVHICTPPMCHVEGALASIEQEKPTIIEKPITHNLDEAIEIYKAATKADVPVMGGMHFRLTPAFLKMSEGLQEEEIGTVTSIESNYVHDMRRLKAGVEWRQRLGQCGFIYEGAAHAIDLNIWLAGQPVDEVQATIGSKKVCPEYGWSEDLNFTLVYEDGTVGRVWSNAAAPLPQHGSRVTVYGSNGAYDAHNKYPFLRTYRDGDSDWSTEPAEVGQTIRPMAALFHEYVKGERDDFGPMPNIEEALKVMIVIGALERAAKSGRVERIPTLAETLAAH
jgi:UDP-N-acetyl-2-amino-2-deoxyglucuronate dehydrogenase